MKKEPYKRPSKEKLPIRSIALFIGLLPVPLAALLRMAEFFDPRLLGGYAASISIVTFLLYRHDKRRAQTGGWRTPETTLHLAELLGGWPAAFLAQRVFRHKTAKTAYQVTFWMIVALHEFAAFDFIQDWRYAKRGFAILSQEMNWR